MKSIARSLSTLLLLGGVLFEAGTARAQEMPPMTANPQFPAPYASPWLATGQFRNAAAEQQQLNLLAAQRAQLFAELQRLEQRLLRLQSTWQAAAQQYRAYANEFQQLVYTLQMIQQQLYAMHPMDPRRPMLVQQAQQIQGRLMFLQQEGNRLQAAGQQLEMEAAPLANQRMVVLQNLQGVTAQLQQLQFTTAQQLQAGALGNAPIDAMTASMSNLLTVGNQNPTELIDTLEQISGVSPQLAQQLRRQLPAAIEAYRQGRLGDRALEVGLTELYDRGLVSEAQQNALQMLSNAQSIGDVGQMLTSADGITSIVQLVQRLTR